MRSTKAAREGGTALGFDFDSMIAVVMALTTADFYKSMTCTVQLRKPARFTRNPQSLMTYLSCTSKGYEYEMSILCGGELVHDTRDMPYTYKGESTIIPAVTGDFARPAMNPFWMRRNPGAQ